MRDRYEAADRTRQVIRVAWERPWRRAGAGLLGAATLFLLFQFAWASPRQARLNMQQQELEQARTWRAEAARTERRLLDVADEIARLAREAAHLVSAYPSDREAPILLRQLHGIAEQSGLTLVAYAPRPPESLTIAETELGGTRWSAQWELTGRFHDFAGFLDRVGILPQVMRVTELVVRAGNPGCPDGTVLAAGTAETFVIDHAGRPAQAPSPSRGATAVNNPERPSSPALTYDPGGRRDPFAPLRATVAPPVPEERPAGLPGIAASELSLRGLVVTSGALLAVLESPGGRSWLVRGGERLLDGVVGSIGTDGVNIRPLAAVTGLLLRLPLGAPPAGAAEAPVSPEADAAADTAGPTDPGSEASRAAAGEEPGRACG